MITVYIYMHACVLRRVAIATVIILLVIVRVFDDFTIHMQYLLLTVSACIDGIDISDKKVIH